MTNIFRAYSKRSGGLFYQGTSLDDIIAEHSQIAGKNETLEEVEFADRETADFIVFEVQKAALDVEFSINPDWISLPEGVRRVGYYRSVTDILEDLDAA